MGRKYSTAATVRPAALTVAGLDPSGGAGLAADLKTFAVLGVHGMAVAAALTVQSGRGVRRAVGVSPRLLRDQLEGVLDDARPDAVKTGMLFGGPIVREVARVFGARGVRPVVDPVLRSTSGAVLLDRPGLAALREELLPLASVVTPNLDEAEALLGMPVRSAAAMRRAARLLVAAGAGAALVKGGHLRGQPVDVWFDGRDELEVWHGRRRTAHARGTGCVLSAALAAGIACGRPAVEAARGAIDLVAAILERSGPLGRGRGPADPLLVLGPGAGAVQGGGPGGPPRATAPAPVGRLRATRSTNRSRAWG